MRGGHVPIACSNEPKGQNFLKKKKRIIEAVRSKETELNLHNFILSYC
ncbi:hypothetical protein SCACP_38600 [Sporomusa carbonis]